MSAPALYTNQVTKQWDKTTALDNLSITVEDGEFYALLGPNGAGKSTLIGVISSLINPTKGTVEIFGKNITENRVWCKAQIGIVPQEFNCNLWEPIEEIVMTTACLHNMDLRSAMQRAHEVLDEVGLKDKIGQTPKDLSGGMKRRLLIARALASKPRLFILDEPTAGVDLEIRHSIWDLLQEYNKRGTTILLTTHYLDEAERLCRQVGFINKGSITYQGTMATVSKLLTTRQLAIYCSAAPVLDKESKLSIMSQEGGVLTVSIPRQFTISNLCSIFTGQNITIYDIKPLQSDLEAAFLAINSSSNNHA